MSTDPNAPTVVLDEPRKMVLRITSGSRAGQEEELLLRNLGEVVLGRDPQATVRFDPDLDDLVSRFHAKIVAAPGEPWAFDLVDLESRNGTLLGGVRVAERSRLRPGDRFQLGAGGPEVVFDLEPRPPAAPLATRLAAGEPTHQAEGAERMPVGRRTVEALVGGSERRSLRWLQLGGLALALLAVVAALLFFLARRDARATGAQVRATEAQLRELEEGRPTSPAEIAESYRISTVMIEAAWTLVHVATGEDVYHCYKQGEPLYVRIAENRVEPRLCQGDGDGGNRKINLGPLQGSGFVVKEDGFILTNRHVVANWRSPFPNDAEHLPLPGKLYDVEREDYDSQPRLVYKRRIEEGERELLAGWIPTRSAFLDARSVEKEVEGRPIFLDVTFAKTALRIPARIVRVSDSHDAALIKIDLPNEVKPVVLGHDYESLKAGDAVSVLGYPVVSPRSAVLVAQLDALDRSADWRQVPDPTLSIGAIGRVIKGVDTPAGGRASDYWSWAGDVYQLTINSTGEGNSGGPVFDDRGRVIGLFTYKAQHDAMVTFAVPIRYGHELMGISPVLR